MTVGRLGLCLEVVRVIHLIDGGEFLPISVGCYKEVDGRHCFMSCTHSSRCQWVLLDAPDASGSSNARQVPVSCDCATHGRGVRSRGFNVRRHWWGSPGFGSLCRHFSTSLNSIQVDGLHMWFTVLRAIELTWKHFLRFITQNLQSVLNQK